VFGASKPTVLIACKKTHRFFTVAKPLVLQTPKISQKFKEFLEHAKNF